VNKISSNNRGSIIIYTIITVSVILMSAIITISILVPKLKLARDVSGSVGAIFAADSLIEWCINESRNSSVFDQPIMKNGATFIISPASCTGVALDHVVTGTYKGVSRAFEIGDATP
jgi:hypothetical protein